ncbi:MAG: molecular chaperone HtpG [Alphaproteobacteria bacterium]|nr:molecular chaperone HtpG [Alphaproteobacteria bacterium]
MQQYNFDVEVGKILNLMINSLYTNKDIALRELISNASDACDKMRYLSAQNPEIGSGELKITITTNKDKKMLIITDNGIGMSHDDLMQNLGTIAKSGTENFVKSLTGDKQKDIQLIGQFGVGFYSAFMIAKSVEVISRKYDDNKVWLWQSEGSSQFTLIEIDDQNSHYIANHGTKIILNLKSEAKEFLDRFHIKHVVQTYSDHINFPIDFVPENIEAGAKIETLNSASALWKKPKEQITEEQYHSFFKHISHLPNQPFMTIHNQVEGALSYTNLLFIPSSKPFDLFHPDRKTSVKLFVKRVFISEELNLVPACMRFLRGLIDSDDLPLNISRESLQHSVVIDKIRKNVVNKVLSELKKKAKDNESQYLEFWNNFGAVLKEGLCESSDFREKILEICRFYSSKSPDKLISLNEYLDRAKSNQDKIYFLTGESVAKIESSPQLEIFIKKDVEVLYLTDAVDEFWVTVAMPYKDKEFQSINRHDVDLEKIDKKNNNSLDDETKESEKADSKDITNSQYQSFLDFIKSTLGDKIQEARISKKLTDSPVCLAVDSRAMDIRLERYLLEQKQLQNASAKILEINPNNPIIQNLNKNFADENHKQNIADSINTLFDLACIIEDEPIKDAKDFSRRLQKLMS